MIQALLVYLAMDLILSLTIVGLVYYRRLVLLPLIRQYFRRFLGIGDLESMIVYRAYKSKLHAKRLNSHLRRLNALKCKPRKEQASSGHNFCSCRNCEYGDGPCEHDCD
jgi:hypothetical protein